MFDASEIATYVAIVLALFAVPGPAVLLTLARSISGGSKAGIATGLGIATGDILHTLMAALGLSAVLMTSAIAFEIVKYLGVCYLIYLGIRMLADRSASAQVPRVASVGAGRAYRQAVLTEILNPKTALFFLSFLPQFVHPDRGAPWAQLLILGAIFVALSIGYTSALALTASRASAWIGGKAKAGRWGSRIAGATCIGLGIHLAFQERG